MSRNYLESIAGLDYVYLDSISFGVVTQETIANLGAFKISYDNIEHKSRNPVSIYEEHFGPEEGSRICPKCQAKECQGHFGYIEFPQTANHEPLMIYNPLYMPIIKKIFSVICMTCSKLAVNKKNPQIKRKLEEIVNMPRALRLAALKNLIGSSTSKYTECVHYTKTGSKNMVCPTKKKIITSGKNDITVDIAPAHTKRGESEPSDLTEDDTNSISRRGKVKSKSKYIQDVDARLVYDIFQYIGGNVGHTDDCDLLGITKEEMKGYFMDCMIFIPTKYRPKSAGKSSDLTRVLTSIIRRCVNFNPEDSSHVLATQKKLQEDVAKYHSLWDNLIGTKEGLIRNKIYGKRPQFAARTVIIPSRTSTINQVEIPEIVASEGLVKEEDVTEENIEVLQDLCFAGKIAYIEKLYGINAGKVLRVKADNVTDNSRHILEVGDKVWKHLQDGDLVGMGRQPTQNLQNIYSAEVKIVPGSVTRININCTPGAAADFDGDTMYTFVTQSREGEEDLKRMRLGIYVRSRQKNMPIYGLTYDAVIAASLLTFHEIKIDPGLYNRCISMYADRISFDDLDRRLKKHDVDKYSGRGLFSTTLPPDFFYTGGEGFRQVVIKDGILISGTLSASTVSNSTGSIVDQMSIQYSPDWQVTFDFINFATWMLADFIDAYGYSVGYTDCMFGYDKGVSAKLAQKVEEAKDEILKLQRPETYYQKIKYEKDVLSIINGLKSVAADLNIFSVDEKENNLIDRMNKYRDHNLSKSMRNLLNVDIEINEENKLALHSLSFLEKFINSQITPNINPVLDRHIRQTIEKAKNEPFNIVPIINDFINKPPNINNLFTINENVNNFQERMNRYVDPKPRETLKNKLKMNVEITAINESSIHALCYLIKYIESDPPPNINSILESRIRHTLEDCANNPLNIVFIIKDFVKSLSYAEMYVNPETADNSLIFLSKFISGAKGNQGNLTAIGLTLGQQLLLGQRLPQTVTQGRRMLVTQIPDSLLPEAKGYIESYYYKGMTPNESFAHAASVREGMATISTVTKSIGDMQRQLDKALEQIKVVQGCPIFHENAILNFSYGDDSMDGLQLLRVDNSYQCADLYQIVEKINSEYKQ